MFLQGALSRTLLVLLAAQGLSCQADGASSNAQEIMQTLTASHAGLKHSVNLFQIACVP